MKDESEYREIECSREFWVALLTHLRPEERTAMGREEEKGEEPSFITLWAYPKKELRFVVK